MNKKADRVKFAKEAIKILENAGAKLSYVGKDGWKTVYNLERGRCTYRIGILQESYYKDEYFFTVNKSFGDYNAYNVDKYEWVGEVDNALGYLERRIEALK